MLKKKTYQFGILAERITILFLRLQAYQILAWRYKTYFGEIDIIAKRGKTIAMIEVKARKTRSNFEDVLRLRQMQRVQKSANYFLSRHPKFQNHQIRFDFVFVNKLFWPTHYKNFFEK
jgi:putative endonuclease